MLIYNEINNIKEVTDVCVDAEDCNGCAGFSSTATGPMPAAKPILSAITFCSIVPLNKWHHGPLAKIPTSSPACVS